MMYSARCAVSRKAVAERIISAFSEDGIRMALSARRLPEKRLPGEPAKRYQVQQIRFSASSSASKANQNEWKMS